MKLSEKIIALRQEKGWSQEEFAERMEVSRQSVSKWETGASTPELDRIVRMCELFGVPADHLINDQIDLSVSELSTRADGGVPSLSLDEAYAFVSARQSSAHHIALGVAACVASPAPMLAMEESFYYGEALGTIILLAMVAWGVWQFIISGSRLKPFSHIRRGHFRPTVEARAWIQSAREQFRPALTREVALGVALCILSPGPTMLSDALGPTFEGIGAAILLLIVAVGCYFLVHSGSIQNCYTTLQAAGSARSQ